jgi:FPC/CPF motif-containing protein YcgG
MPTTANVLKTTMSIKHKFTQNKPSHQRGATKLGAAKSRKFAAVEGLSLTPQSARSYHDLTASGLRGESLRAAIKSQFIAKAKK